MWEEEKMIIAIQNWYWRTIIQEVDRDIDIFELWETFKSLAVSMWYSEGVVESILPNSL